MTKPEENKREAFALCIKRALQGDKPSMIWSDIPSTWDEDWLIVLRTDKRLTHIADEYIAATVQCANKYRSIVGTTTYLTR
jgi:hypothetical protein